MPRRKVGVEREPHVHGSNGQVYESGALCFLVVAQDSSCFLLASVCVITASRRPRIEMAAPQGNGRPKAEDFGNDKSPSLSGDESKDGGGDSKPGHDEHAVERTASTATRKASVAALLRNPLTGMSEEEALADVDSFVEDKGLQEYREAFRKGAMLARVNQRQDGFEYVSSVSEDEKEVLRKEISSRWSQPFMLYFLVILCAGSAIVQGMDQTAVNGAQVNISNAAI